MKAFLDADFLLENETARRLYHDYARDLPIIDYHCHLPPADIAGDRRFANLTRIWLEGDHYKWRAMRTRGVPEDYITGGADDYEKFAKWAETVPYTMRNPLYHWTHLELQRYFGIDTLLTPATAREIYDACTATLQEPGYTTRGLLGKMRVEVVCTTDDPTDKLPFHQEVQAAGLAFQMRPTFRPDKALAVEDPVTYRTYLQQLETVTGSRLEHFIDLLNALQQRVDYFHALGCRLSDHGLETMYATAYTDAEVNFIFHKVSLGHALAPDEVDKFKSCLLLHLGEMYHEKGWTQQFHLGALRNANTRMKRRLGPDTGWDSIGDWAIAQPLARYLDRLDQRDRLARTILYNLNPRDNEVLATMIGNFNDGSIAGKVQFGSAWWFLDQKDGMEKQLNALSNMGLLSEFVGMLTDSRSFLSYPRHEYFRRIVCNLFGRDVEKGELPSDLPWLGHLVQRICYENARAYFGFFDQK